MVDDKINVGAVLKPRTYNIITGLCLLMAVASAFLFDAFSGLRWFAGGCAALAALIGTGTYFYQQWATRSDESCAATSPHKTPSALEQPTKGILLAGFQLKGLRLKEDTDALFSSTLHWMDVAVRSESDTAAAWHEQVLHYYRHNKVASPSTIDVNTIVEIVQKLSASEKRYEFILTGEGYLTIKPLSTEEHLREHIGHLAKAMAERSFAESAQPIDSPDQALESLDSWQSSTAKPN